MTQRVTRPIALDRSFNTTESTPRNIADVLAENLLAIKEAIENGADTGGAFIVSYGSTTAQQIYDAIRENKVPYLYYNGVVAQLWKVETNKYTFRTTETRVVDSQTYLDIIDYSVTGVTWDTDTKTISGGGGGQTPYFAKASSVSPFDTTGKSGSQEVVYIDDVPEDGVYQVSVLMGITPQIAAASKSDLVFKIVSAGSDRMNNSFHAIVDDSELFAQQVSFSLSLDLKAGRNSFVLECDSLTTSYLISVDIMTIASLVNGNCSGGGTQEQADWNESDTQSASYIKNKPAIPVVKTLVAGQNVTLEEDQDSITINATGGSGGGSQFVLSRSDITTAFTNTEYQDCIDSIGDNTAVCVQFTKNGTDIQAQLTQYKSDGTLVFEFDDATYHYTWSVAPTAGAHNITEKVYQVLDEPSYFINISGTLYPCTKIYCPDAHSYDENEWNSKWSLWMAENLRETLGTIGTNEWYVNNSQTLADTKKYGHLYTWDVAHQFEGDLQTMGLRAGADLRTGWHLPLTNEVSALRAADAQADSYFKAGIINATNSSGLTLDLTGRYNASQGIMQNWQAYGYWWCSQQSDSSNAQGMYGINYNSTSLNTTPFPKGNGNAIRLTLHLLDNGEIPEEFKDYVVVQYRKSVKEVKTICGSTYSVTNDGNWRKEHGSSAPFESIVNVDDFGAAGDGVTDDTACFQMAMNYNLGVTGTRGKSYFVKNLQVGAGTRRTILKNCTLVSPNNKTDDCLIVTAYSEIDGCTISNYSKAIKAVRSARPVINARIENCRISQCLNGIWMYTDSSWSSGNSVDVFDIVISKNYITEIGDQLGAVTWPTDDGTGRGIKAHGHMDGVKITENVIEYCWCGVEIGNDCSYFWAPGWSILNNFFEGHSIAPIYLSSLSYKTEWTYGNPDRRMQLYVSGNYLSDYDGGAKNKVYGSYDFWVSDWTPSIYPCYGNGKDIIGLLKSGNDVMNNGLYRGESYLYMCGPDVSTLTGTQMKDTAITLWPGVKKYGRSLTIYKHHMKVTIDAVLSSPLVLSNADNSVSITNGLNEYDFVFSSPLFTADRLLTGSEEVRILKIEIV